MCISCRAGRGNVGTTSGLSTSIATATESGLVAQHRPSRISELVFPPLTSFPVGTILPVGILAGSGFLAELRLPVRATEEPWSWSFLRD